LDLAVEHFCLARNDLRLAGLLFLIRMLGSPKRIIFSVPPWHPFKTNFFGPSGVRRGLLQAIFFLSSLDISNLNTNDLHIHILVNPPFHKTNQFLMIFRKKE